MYQIVRTSQAKKDFDKIAKSNLRKKALNLLAVIEKTPYAPPVEKLAGYENVYSRRINKQHRLVYEVFEQEKVIKIISAWTHYENI